MPVPTQYRPRLLIADLDPAIVTVIERLGTRAGFETETCHEARVAADWVERRPPDLMIVGLSARTKGHELLTRFRELAPACDIILMAHAGQTENAVEAVKEGARDFLVKPLDLGRLGVLLAEVRDELDRRTQVASLESDLARQLEFCGMLGRSPSMQELFSLVQRLAPHTNVALIRGEAGTGKELTARAFHRCGRRHGRPLVSVRGSAAEASVLEPASGATLLIDEITELTPEFQTALLQVVGDGSRRGMRAPYRTGDVAVLATSTCDVANEAAAGRFSRPLYDRLRVVEIVLPALRDRREDIPYLAAAFIRNAASRLRQPPFSLTAAAERLLLSAFWAENVRELKDIVERACMIANGSSISERELALAMKARRMDGDPRELRIDCLPADTPEAMVDIEREHIVSVLQQMGGNRMAAAKALGISRRALYRRLERYKIGAEAPARRVHLRRPR
jgi:DNA-binding NtrC family response regulator